MKCKVVVGIFLLFSLVSGIDVHAQGKGPMDPMSEGSWLINLGVGPGIHYFTGYRAGFGPGFQASFEKGMWQLGPGVLTLGAELGFSYFWYKYYFVGNYGYQYTWLSIIPAARCAYHYGWKVNGLDTYGGVSTGMRFTMFNDTYYDNYRKTGYNPALIGFMFGTFVGASYFFTNSFGVNGEFGYNVNWAQIGVVFKVN